MTTYGMTETGSGVVYDGRPLDGVEVRIEANGEVYVRGPMLLRAYRNGTDPLVDGWLATGDQGRWLADGRLTVLGRRGDLIITGGENVWPEPVERRAANPPGGRRRSGGRHARRAVGSPGDGVRGAGSRRHPDPGRPPPAAARAVLPAYCARAGWSSVAAIPRTSIGKPQRALLRAQRAPAT